MVAVLRRVDDHTIALLLEHPRLIHRVLSDQDEGEEAPTPAPGFFARLLGRAAPASLPPITVEREAGDTIDLDKAWNAIHFMLTNSADDTDHPLGFLFSGGEVIDEEVGYGPARAFSAAQTQEIARLVAEISREDFLGRYDAPAMFRAKVYPDALWAPDRVNDDLADYVVGNFDFLKQFLSAAAAAKQGFLVFLS
ncbi:MAG TPA: YfbM family protein [Lacunisphaera sp.]|nr:YfbM family protein [Lacunisphaera sp.]